MNTGGRRWRHIIATGNLGAWLLIVVWALIVFVLLTEPHLADTGRQRMRFGLFAFGHGVFFTIFGFLLANGLIRLRLPRFQWWTVVILILYGIVGELVQTTVPGRTPSIIDLLADAIGALLGVLAWTVLARLYTGAPLRGAMRVWSRGRTAARELAALDRSILAATEHRWNAE